MKNKEIPTIINYEVNQNGELVKFDLFDDLQGYVMGLQVRDIDFTAYEVLDNGQKEELAF